MSRTPEISAQELTRAGPLAETNRLSVILGAGERLERLGPYRVVGTLGKGGMGVVYEVSHPESDDTFALKTIEARFLELSDSQAGRRFHQEIMVLRKLEHPSVVRMFDYGLAQHPMGYEIAFFLMERLRGDAMDVRLKRGDRLSPLECARVAQDVTQALEYLDAHGVQHRDLKPGNLFLKDGGRVVLMDFGLARSAEFTRLTRAGHVIGTLPYMSPEALRAEETTIASELYALGVVMFEALAGRHPYTAKDPTQMVGEIKKGLSFPPELIFQGEEARVRDLIAEMLQPRAKDRPSPRDVAERAADIVARLTSSAPPQRTQSYNQPAAIVQEGGPKIAQESAVPVPTAAPARHVDPASVSRVPAVAQPTAVPFSATHPAGPSWLLALVMSLLFGTLTFVAGVLIGRSPRKATEAAQVIAEAEPPKRIAAPVVRTIDPPAEVDPFASVPKFGKPQDAFQWGNKALEAGRFEPAAAAFKQAVTLDPTFAMAHRRLGDAYMGLERWAGVRGAYAAFVALKPDDPDADRLKALLRDLPE